MVIHFLKELGVTKEAYFCQHVHNYTPSKLEMMRSLRCLCDILMDIRVLY